MERKFIELFAVSWAVLCLVGCGHKSNTELIDIEQFKCQDSIQTVFDVLGETDMDISALEGEEYTYEGLNLWGYDGKVVFKVRDDKETISSFYCSLTLTEKEFKDVLSQFQNQYGLYKISNYGETDKTYSWDIDGNEEDSIGYNRITIQYNGDKKYIVSFYDEWSGITDEAYYEHLEEEKEVEILAQETYNIGEDTFNFSLGQREDGEYSFILYCNVEDKSDAYMTHISLNSLFNNDEESLKELTETMNFTYCIIIGDGAVLVRSKDLLILKKGEEIIDVNDYFPADWILGDERKDSDYGEQVVNFLADFIDLAYS